MARAILLSVLCLGTVVQAKPPSAPPEVKAAMQELWRRGTCLLSSVLKPAAKESAVPRDIAQTPVVRPRLLSAKGALTCYAVAGRTIWAADDQGLYQVDAAAGKVVRRYDAADGLPDAAIHSLAVSGGDVWLATRQGLARLDGKTGRIAAVPEVRFALGRVVAGPGGVWVVSDTGAYHLPDGQKRWRKLAEFPNQKALAAIVRRGFWWALWRTQMRSLLGAPFATDDGLYVLCLNRLLRYAPTDGQWKQIGDKVWQAMPHGRAVWALTTGGVSRYDPAADKTDAFRAGAGLAAGRPIAMAATKSALFVASQPDYDPKTRRFVGGGLSRLDLATGAWTVTEKVGDEDIRFVSALAASGEDVWAACTLYDRVVQLGAHPGMAHVKRWRPNAAGLGLLRWSKGTWSLAERRNIEAGKRWVLGQKGKLGQDRIVPKLVETLCCRAGRVWGVYRMMPSQYYSGYYISAGCLADGAEGRLQGRFDIRTAELGLGGEQPELMLISHSHGVRIVLAAGHPVVLGIEEVAGKAWAVCENGLFAHDPAADKFAPVLRVGFRAYWRVSSAAAGKEAVWFGGDAGTISRLDRKSGRLELLGVVPGRKITALAVADAAGGGAVMVRTAKATVVLPVSLRSAPKLPEADTLRLAGGTWSAATGDVPAAKTDLSCQRRGNYLYRGGRRVAFVKGVFRPIVLCDDPVAGTVWLGTFSGAAGVALPARPAE